MSISETVESDSGSVQSEGVFSVSSMAVSSGVAVSDVGSNSSDMVVAQTEIVSSVELGFSAVVLGIGLIAGFILSKIVNWWKW